MVFETKNAKFVSFQKGFFCQPFFEKIQTFGFPELFIKQKNINIQKKYWSISYFIIKTAI